MCFGAYMCILWIAQPKRWYVSLSQKRGLQSSLSLSLSTFEERQQSKSGVGGDYETMKMNNTWLLSSWIRMHIVSCFLMFRNGVNFCMTGPPSASSPRSCSFGSHRRAGVCFLGNIHSGRRRRTTRPPRVNVAMHPEWYLRMIGIFPPIDAVWGGS